MRNRKSGNGRKVQNGLRNEGNLSAICRSKIGNVVSCDDVGWRNIHLFLFYSGLSTGREREIGYNRLRSFYRIFVGNEEIYRDVSIEQADYAVYSG